MAYIEIPDALHQRLLSLGCATSDFYTNALEEALRRRALTNQKRAVGRPAPAIEKVRKTYNLDSDVTERIAELSVSDPTKSESAVANRILRKSLFPDEE